MTCRPAVTVKLQGGCEDYFIAIAAPTLAPPPPLDFSFTSAVLNHCGPELPLRLLIYK